MICHRFLTHKNLRKRNFQSTFDDVVVKMRFSKVAVKYLNKHKKWPKVENKLCYRSKFWSEWQGSNLRPDGPKPPALPAAPHPVIELFIRLGVFSQSKRATNCANPGFLVIEFCARCGQTCGHGDFLTTSTCGGSACIADVSRDCGHGIFRLEGGATRSQTTRNTNFAIPGYNILL